MTGKVLGYENISYTKKDTGELVEGVNAHVVCNPPKNIEFEGEMVKEVYVSDVLLKNTVKGFDIGSTYVFDYVQNGKYASLVDIIPV